MNIVNANEKMLFKREIVIISMGPIQSGEITEYFVYENYCVALK